MSAQFTKVRANKIEPGDVILVKHRDPETGIRHNRSVQVLDVLEGRRGKSPRKYVALEVGDETCRYLPPRSRVRRISTGLPILTKVYVEQRGWSVEELEPMSREDVLARARANDMHVTSKTTKKAAIEFLVAL